jgi:hypothetical protein
MLSSILKPGIIDISPIPICWSFFRIRKKDGLKCKTPLDVAPGKLNFNRREE